MIEDITEAVSRPSHPADVIVIGSGIAGFEVASTLVKSGRRVILLESGRRDFDERIQAQNELIFAAKAHREQSPEAPYHRYLPSHLRGVSRLRQLGGTSNLWTGKWKHMQASDFDARSWVPNSGWPIEFEDLLPHYRSTAIDYNLGDLEAEAERQELDQLRTAIAPAGLKLTSFFWEETPTRTASRLLTGIGQDPNLHVVLGATVTALNSISPPQTDKKRIHEVVAQGPEDQTLRVSGSNVVLATGAIETARLLLASGQTQAEQLGNATGLVGRFYTDHLKHHEGYLEPGPLTQKYAAELQYGPKPRFCICFALDDATQSGYQLLEHVLYLKPEYSQGFFQAMRNRITAGHPTRDQNGWVMRYKVKFVSEHVPHLNSRVYLSRERDCFGQYKPVLDWNFTDIEPIAVTKAAQLCVERFAQAGLGRLDFGSTPVTIDGCTDAAHQMGTTRMGLTPQDGVVDTNCRVFGTENLFIASSAVFPSCPSYSPTFTILALARRLAVHLTTQSASAP